MAAKMTKLPSDTIAKDAPTDEFGKDMKGKNIGGFSSPSEASASTPEVLGQVLDRCRKSFKGANLKLKNEKDSSISIIGELPDGGAPEIVPAFDPEIEAKKAVFFLKAPMSTEFSGGDNKKEMVVKVFDLPPLIDRNDMVIGLEDRRVVIELKNEVKDYGKIEKFAELPDGVTASRIWTVMQDTILTVTVALDVNPKPGKKPKSIISKIRGALPKAWPACFAIGGKMAYDAITNDGAN